MTLIKYTELRLIHVLCHLIIVFTKIEQCIVEIGKIFVGYAEVLIVNDV